MSAPDNSTFLSFFLDTPIYSLKEDVQNLTTKKETEILPPKYLGDNQKGIIILIDTLEQDFLNSIQGKLLLKICSAVSLNISDVALVNLKENGHFTGSLEEFINYKTIISFGVIWEQAGITSEIELYQHTTYKDKTILISDALSKLENDIEAKKSLWQALKQIFT